MTWFNIRPRGSLIALAIADTEPEIPSAFISAPEVETPTETDCPRCQSKDWTKLDCDCHRTSSIHQHHHCDVCGYEWVTPESFWGRLDRARYEDERRQAARMAREQETQRKQAIKQETPPEIPPDSDPCYEDMANASLDLAGKEDIKQSAAMYMMARSQVYATLHLANVITRERGCP